MNCIAYDELARMGAFALQAIGACALLFGLIFGFVWLSTNKEDL